MQTSVSLLVRLRQDDQPAAWERFVKLYYTMLLSWAKKQGLQEADAADLVQELLVKLIRLLPSYNRGEGQSFRGWLFQVCRNQCRDFRRRKSTGALPGADGLSSVGVESPIAHYEDMEDLEYRRELLQRGLELIRSDFSDATWAAFEGLAITRRTAAELAAELNISVNAVYLAQNRVMNRLREELDGLLD